MEKILEKRFFIFLLAFGALFSFLLSLFSKSTPLTIIFKTLLTAIVFGVIGMGLDVFLIKTLGEEEYEKIFHSVEKEDEKTSESPGKPNLNIVDKATEEEKYEYEELIKNREPSVKESTPEETAFENETPKIKESPTFGTKEEAPQHFKETTFTGFKDIKKEIKEIKNFDEEFSLSGRKLSSDENEVTFKVKNRKISTSPEVVAKAIKTILKKDEGGS